MRLTIFISTIVSMLLTFGSANAADLTKGKKLYIQNCAQCHGAHGKPTLARAPNFQRQEGLRVSDKSLLARIKRGKKSCPAFGGRLRDEQIVDLIGHLRTFR